jgi:hypothetical protein
MTYDELLTAAIDGSPPTRDQLDRLPLPPGHTRQSYRATCARAIHTIVSAPTKRSATVAANEARRRHDQAWQQPPDYTSESVDVRAARQPIEVRR